MKTTRPQHASRAAPSREVVELRARLADTEATLRAIRNGEVDAVVVAGKRGSQVFTLEGADHAYRVLIESMNEGALTLTARGLVLYANQRFARMVKGSLAQVMGSSFRRFLPAENWPTLQALLKRPAKSGSKIQVLLNADGGSKMPVQISIRPLAGQGFNRATIGLVVTDMTDARRSEAMLRALTHRVVEAQEAERRLVALELHDHITQMLCAVLVRSQALANTLSPCDGPSKQAAIELRDMLGETAEEVERISRHLRPSVLDELGLVRAVHAHCTEFAARTGLSLKLACKPLTARLPAETELALYRILQESLNNVERHAGARHVTIWLRRQGAFVELAITDNGLGLDLKRDAARRKEKGSLGLLSMRERAACVGGAFKIKSIHGVGTEIEVRIPLPPSATAAN